MENLLIPQVIVETPAYLRAVEDFWDSDTQSEFKNFIGVNFLLGDIIPDTGGIPVVFVKSVGKVPAKENVVALALSTTSMTRIIQSICSSLIPKIFKLI